jgi:hypothetical protein
MSQYVVVPAGPAWVLATVGTSSDVNEEFVSAFQGIICKKDLPPFTEKIGYVFSHLMPTIINSSSERAAHMLDISVRV